MKPIKIGQKWEYKHGRKGTSKYSIKIKKELNVNCWAYEHEHGYTGLITREELNSDFVIVKAKSE